MTKETKSGHFQQKGMEKLKIGYNNLELALIITVHWLQYSSNWL